MDAGNVRTRGEGKGKAAEEGKTGEGEAVKM